MKLLFNLKTFLSLAVFLLPITVKGNENTPTSKIVATYFEHPILASISDDKDIDDKTTNRHKNYLQQGKRES